MLENVAFFKQNGEKSHLVINIESGGRRELASCPKVFVWDRRSLSSHHLCAIRIRFIMNNSLPFNQLDVSIPRERKKKGTIDLLYLTAAIPELHSLIAINWLILAKIRSSQKIFLLLSCTVENEAMV